MVKDNKILLGKAGDQEIYMLPNQANRHGLIAGASGTGKTVTLKVIAESLSEMGVPTFIADVKGDLTGMVEPGEQTGVTERLQSMGLPDLEVRSYPVNFYDVYGQNGHPMRAVLQEMDPVLLARILDLTEVQEGVLNIIFRAAKDMELDLIDLKDLQAMAIYVGQHASEYTLKYGNVSAQSVGAIQRKLLQLENQKGNLMFGLPALSIDDLMMTIGGMGVMNILECQELFRYPMLYSTFLLWLLDKIYHELPEVGDPDKPRMVFFFDEAHVLFDHASKALLDRIEQIVKLIRSKGVGIFFCTQSPSDIPDSVLAQLSNRIQHALRAYTPSEMKAVKTAAQSFRPNPAFDTEEVIMAMKTGHALVSVLDREGAPTVVEEAKILPPRSSMKAADPAIVRDEILHDAIYGKYENSWDPVSAYEMVNDLSESERREAEEAKAETERAKQEAREEAAREKQLARDQAAREREEDRRQREEEREAEKERQRRERAIENAQRASRKEEEKEERERSRLRRKIQNKAENEVINFGFRSAKKFLKDLLK